MEKGVARSAQRVFEEMCEDVVHAWDDLDEEPLEEFFVHIAPCWTRHRGAEYSILNAFKIVLEGAVQASEHLSSSIRVLEIIEPGDGGKNNAHSFLITAMPYPAVQTSLAMPTFWSFAFVGVATSGYGGTGQDIHDRIREMLMEREGGVLRTRVVKVDRDPLEEVFLQKGPILHLRYPDRLLPWSSKELTDGAF